VELAGLASPYETVTGFQVTPVVGFVRPGFELTVNASEVADVFEVPLAQLLRARATSGGPSNGRARRATSTPCRSKTG
jgi:hypothetical protein